MSIVFNADEIFAMAEQIEVDGAAFYRKAAKTASASSGRGLLLQIAAQEDEHLAKFKKMRKELSGAQTEPTAFDPYGEAILYLKAMAEGKVFAPEAADAAGLKGKESLAEIVRIAIGLEKDSIVFYLGLKDAVPEKLGGDKVADIIREEMKHIRWLSEKLGTGKVS